MTGINRTTGQAMPRAEHIRQSIADILFTPKGTRIAREDYGIDLPDLIDHPQNKAMQLRLAAASYIALVRWEPRIAVQKITTSAPAANGQRTIEIQAIDRENRQPFAASIPLARGAA